MCTSDSIPVFYAEWRDIPAGGRRSGVRGVAWNKTGCGWECFFTTDRKERRVFFSARRFGDEAAFRMAVARRREAEESGASVKGRTLYAKPVKPVDLEPKTKTVIRVERRQSGVPGVSWNSPANAWSASYCRNNKQVCKLFGVGVHGEEEALRLAIEWRTQALESGKGNVRKPASLQSGVVGVSWKESSQAWGTKFSLDGKKVRGYFAVSTYGSIEVALEAAIAHRKQMEEKHYVFQLAGKVGGQGALAGHDQGGIANDSVDITSDSGHIANPHNRLPKSGVAGVYWSRSNRGWSVPILVDGKRRYKFFSVKKYGDEEALRLASEFKASSAVLDSSVVCGDVNSAWVPLSTSGGKRLRMHSAVAKLVSLGLSQDAVEFKNKDSRIQATDGAIATHLHADLNDPDHYDIQSDSSWAATSDSDTMELCDDQSSLLTEACDISSM